MLAYVRDVVIGKSGTCDFLSSNSSKFMDDVSTVARAKSKGGWGGGDSSASPVLRSCGMWMMMVMVMEVVMSMMV